MFHTVRNESRGYGCHLFYNATHHGLEQYVIKNNYLLHNALLTAFALDCGTRPKQFRTYYTLRSFIAHQAAHGKYQDSACHPNNYNNVSLDLSVHISNYDFKEQHYVAHAVLY